MNIKRALCMVLSLVLAITVLTGCSDKKVSDVKQIEILLNAGHSKQFYEKKVIEFNDTLGKERGIEIVLNTKVDASYDQALKIAMQSDQLPDFFSHGNIRELVENDAVYPISELNDTAGKIEKAKNMLVEDSHTVNNVVYSLPAELTLMGIIYNKDMFKEAGIIDKNGNPTPPKTLDELRKYAKKLTDTKNSKYGIAFPLKWNSWVNSDVISLSSVNCGFSGYNPATGKYDYTTLKPVLETFMGIKEDKSYFPGAEGLDNDPARARFSEGQIGMKVAYSFDVGVLNEQFEAKCDWGVAPLPVADKNKKYLQPAGVSAGLRVSKRGIERHGVEAMSVVFNWWHSEEMSKELYEQGLAIPYDASVIANSKEPDVKGWKEFCQIADISKASARNMPRLMDGKKSLTEVIVNDIWTGKIDIETALKDYTKASNEGVKLYQKTYPDIDYSQYIIKDWNSKR